MTPSNTGFKVTCCLAITLLFLFFYRPPVWGQAQVPSGSIVGTVTDPTGAVVANATVTVTNTGTNTSSTVKTDPAGNFTAPLLQVGTYSVTVRAAGFSTFVASDLSLTAGG